jgi:hypothetical protein
MYPRAGEASRDSAVAGEFAALARFERGHRVGERDWASAPAGRVAIVRIRTTFRTDEDVIRC